MPPKVLSVSNLNSFYGNSQVLFDVDMEIFPAETLSLVGRNGVGKTTLIKSIMGIEVQVKGKMELDSVSIHSKSTAERAQMGIAYCPDNRGIFASLSVFENLLLAFRGDSAARAKYLERVFTLFPVLKTKSHLRGNQISGGEQQMLAIARTLANPAKLFIFDEPSEGLAPVIVEIILHAFEKLKAEGCSLLLVEQNFSFCYKISDRFVVMDQGRVKDVFKNEDGNLSQQKIKEALSFN